MLDFGREVCGNLESASQREWLVTNGIGGYASGTLAGLLTRSYHGLLIAALSPPVARTLLLAKLDDTASYDGSDYPLFTNRWANGVIDPDGYRFLERFRLEGTTPLWTYACADALLDKRVWMQPGANTTYIRYDLRRASRPLKLSIKALVNYRDHHATTLLDGSHELRAEAIQHGLQVRLVTSATDSSAAELLPPFYLLSAQAQVTPQNEWNWDFYLSVEAYRGEKPVQDLMTAGVFEAELNPGESLTLVASTQASPDLDGFAAYQARQAYEQELLTSLPGDAPDWVRHLCLAADQFIVQRASPRDPQGKTVIAGYPWFTDWGRDTMISLPGLALVSGRAELAGSILRTFADFVDKGMLPNRFPDAGEKPEYNTADASLWYFQAIGAYHAATGDDELLRALFPVLEDIIACHQAGTRYQIHADPQDGLLYAGEPGVQLTWMDAKVDDWVVTPRIGKPVEINALWYNALRLMAAFARKLGKADQEYEAAAQKAEAGFERFWNEKQGFCFDTLDGPDGNEDALRPNQLLAVSLPHSPLAPERQRAVVEVCARRLLASRGLRSLAPGEPGYHPHYGGDRHQRDGAYHQGTVWGWLVGPFISAHLRVYQDPERAATFLEPFRHHIKEHGLGSISEIFDGDPPFTPRGCIAQAWSVAEVLRAWREISDWRKT